MSNAVYTANPVEAERPNAGRDRPSAQGASDCSMSTPYGDDSVAFPIFKRQLKP